MSKPTSASLWPLTPVAIFWVISGALYGLSHTEPSSPIAWGSQITLMVAAAFWLAADARAHRTSLVYDWGFILTFTWPVVFPLHAYRTRGRAGLRIGLAMIGAMFALQLGAAFGGLLRIFWRVS